MTKYVLFTHDDLDGAGCRIVFDLAMATMETSDMITHEAYNCSIANIDDKVREYIEYISEKASQGPIPDHEFILADIVCSRELINELNKIGPVSVFDHHPTNSWVYQENLSGNVQVIINGEKPQSGTSVMYHEFYYRKFYGYFNPLLDLFVDTVRSYDTYEFKETGNMTARHLQIIFTLLGMDRFINKYFSRIYAIGPGTVEVSFDSLKKMLITDDEMEFVTAKLENEAKIIETFNPNNVITFHTNEYLIGFIYWPSFANVSELSNKFLEKFPQYDIFITFTMSENGGEFSMRTKRDNIDVGAICKGAGGGGHPKAAGYRIYDVYGKEIVDKLLDSLSNTFSLDWKMNHSSNKSDPMIMVENPYF